MEKDRTTTGTGSLHCLGRRLYSKQACFHLKLFAFGMGLILLLTLTATPVYVHYFEPINLSEIHQESSYQVISAVRLARSVCSSTFPNWSESETANHYRNISASGCGNFDKMEEDLKILKQLMATYLPRLLDRLLPILCHYAYTDCRDKFCKRESSSANALCDELSKLRLDHALHLLKNRMSCLPFPKCARNQSEACPTPLIPTRTEFAQTFGLYCSPSCDQPIWKVRAKIFKIAQYVSVSLYWVCIGIVLVTWAKAKKLFSYQSVTSLFSTASLALISSAITIPAILGEKYCKYDNFFDSFLYPTRICHVQGLLFQFGYLSFLMWWLNSVSNSALTVWKPGGFSNQNKKRLFFFQMTLSVILPSGQLAFSLVKRLKYVRESRYDLFCGSLSNRKDFYSFLLPANILVLCGTVMSAYVVIRLYQVKKTSLFHLYVANRQEFAENFALVQKRFLLLSIVIPVSFTCIAATSAIRGHSMANGLASCMSRFNETLVNQCISKLGEETGWFVVLTINFVVSDLVSLAFVGYCLLPKPARAFWSQLPRLCAKRKFTRQNCDVTTESESPSATTPLFPSSTAPQLLPTETDTSS